MARAVTKFPAQEPDEDLEASRRRRMEDPDEPPQSPAGTRGKPRREKKPKSEKPHREKKPATPMGIALRTTAMVSGLYILLFFAGTVALYFDLGGIREPVNRFFNMGDLTIEAQKSVLKDREDALTRREQTLKTEKEEAAALQAELAEREKVLDKRDEALTESQQEADALAARLEGELENIEAAALIYEKMDAAAAAEVLSGLGDNALAVRILKRMKPASAAAILGQMDTEKAVAIMTLMS